MIASLIAGALLLGQAVPAAPDSQAAGDARTTPDSAVAAPQVRADDDLYVPPPEPPAGRGIAAGVLIVAFVTGGGILVYRRIVERRYASADGGGDRDWPLPPLIVPPTLRSADGSRIRPASWPGTPQAAPPPATPAAPPGTLEAVPAPAVRTAPPPPAVPQPAPQPAPPRPAPPQPVPRPVAQQRPPMAAPPRPAPHVEGAENEEVRVGAVVFHRPLDGTLQLLPGRLELLSGQERVEEVRFVRVPGREPVVTFGRNPGEPHMHIQLDSPTVSRQHASMRYRNGRWSIANLSHTNPVVVRGVALSSEGDAVVLEDGDRVEFGEVVFRYRAR